MNAIDSAWLILGPLIGEAEYKSDKIGSEMEYQLCFHLGSPEEKRAWQEWEEARDLYGFWQTAVRRIFERLGNPVTYIGSTGVILSDETSLKYPK